MNVKKKVVALATAGAALLAAGTAFAYFTTTGSGTGTGAVGTSTAMTLNQVTPVNADYSAADGLLYPGTTQTIRFTVSNPSPGNQLLNVIHLASWTSNKPGCNSAADANAQAAWITVPDVAVNQNYPSGANQAVSQTATATFNNLTTTDQSACKNATLTFSFTSN